MLPVHCPTDSKNVLYVRLRWQKNHQDIQLSPKIPFKGHSWHYKTNNPKKLVICSSIQVFTSSHGSRLGPSPHSTQGKSIQDSPQFPAAVPSSTPPPSPTGALCLVPFKGDIGFLVPQGWPIISGSQPVFSVPFLPLLSHQQTIQAYV